MSDQQKQDTTAVAVVSSFESPSASQGDGPGAARRLATGASGAEGQPGTDLAVPRGADYRAAITKALLSETPLADLTRVAHALLVEIETQADATN